MISFGLGEEVHLKTFLLERYVIYLCTLSALET